MAQSIIFPEWLNANALRSYPIRENASRTDTSGNFTIPNDLIVAAQINCPRSYADGTFYISRIVVGISFVSIYVSYQPASGDPVDISYVKAETDPFSRFSYYSFVGQGDLSNVMGYITIGEVEESVRQGIGEFLFSSTSTPLEVNTYFVSVPAMESVEILTSSGQTLHKATRILKLKAGENIRLTYDTTGDPDPYGTIRIDAINGENLVKPSECGNVAPLLPPCIRMINGVSPDATGHFWIDESECIEIQENQVANSIKVIDKCSQSCCGCDQLQELTDALEGLKLQEETLRNLIISTQTQQSELLANIISNLT